MATTPAPAFTIAYDELPADFYTHIAEIEVCLLRAAMEQSNFVQKRAAERLGLTYRQFRHLAKKYDVI